MNGDRMLLDTNAFIYFFEGRPKVTALVLRTSLLCFSPITEIELLSARHLTDHNAAQIRNFLALCQRVDLTSAVVMQTVLIRRQYGFKVPDAIIAASADTSFQRLTSLTLISDIL